MKTGLIFLLLSGVVLVSCNFTRFFHYVKMQLIWSDAQRYCRKHFTDLATIQDSDQNAKAKVAAESGEAWIGLHRKWEWTVGHEDILPGFTNWHSEEQWRNSFVLISREGKWSTKTYLDVYPFICYNATTDRHFLVPEPLTWKNARSHCRQMSAELSRIRNEKENEIVATLLNSQGEDFTYSLAWIGLSRSIWKWSDGKTMSFKNWGDVQAEVQLPRCVLMKGDWYIAHCKSEHHFLCYTDVPHIDARSVKIQLSQGSADLNDPAVQNSILQQLKQKLEERDPRGVKLKWKIQPDGKVFHKEEEERAPPSGDCEDII